MYRYVKRLIDLLVAAIACTLLSLPLLIVAIFIKLDSKGPIVFKHKRYGQYKMPFTLYKFRSMAESTPNDRPTNGFKDADTYITRVGRIIRKLSIDELPQLLNVLKGDMSIVGPRPVVLGETRLIAERQRQGANTCKPGITGWAQVHGRDLLSDHEKAKLDGYYAKNLSLWLDLLCLVKTIWTITSLAGHTEGHERQSIQNRETV